MTREEEEVQHDISKLQDHMQQSSLSKRVTKNEMEAKMDGLKKGVEANMDGLKKGMEAKMDGLKNGVEAKMDDMEEKMEGMKNNLKHTWKVCQS